MLKEFTTHYLHVFSLSTAFLALQADFMCGTWNPFLVFACFIVHLPFGDSGLKDLV